MSDNQIDVYKRQEIILGNHIRKVPSVAVGCMRLSEKSKDEMNRFIHASTYGYFPGAGHSDKYFGAKPYGRRA